MNKQTTADDLSYQALDTTGLRDRFLLEDLFAQGQLQLAPGYIATDNTQALQDDPVRAGQILARIPAGRWGEPADFKGPTVFLASEASNYVNGETLVVDGGWMGR